jgi:putative cell wall-binding protein
MAPAAAAPTPIEIWVSPAGSDMTGLGTRAEPFRSIREAMTRASMGDTIWVLPGEYGPTHGEDYPIRLKTGVALRAWGPGKPRVLSRPDRNVFSLEECDGQTLLEGFEIDGEELEATDWRPAAIVIDRSGDTGGPTIRDCWIHDYRTSTVPPLANGGGIQVIDPKAAIYITDCVITDNRASGSGGGIYASSTPGFNGEVWVQGCTITFNEGAYPPKSAGGIDAEYLRELHVVDSVIMFNQAGGGAGGIMAAGTSQASIINSVIAKNQAGGLNGAILTVDTPTLIECSTVWGNRSTSGAHGIQGAGTGSRIVRSSIVWNHELADVVGFHGVYHSCIENPAVAGAGTIHDNPQFADPTLDWPDLRLQRTSPCIDSGDPVSMPPDIPFHDLDGFPRIADGNPFVGADVDMGPYEAPPLGVDRWSGANRYATAIAAWKEVLPAGCAWAVITTGEDFPDALSASALAGAVEGPLLLTPKAALHPDIATTLESWGVRGVYIVGGTAAVGQAVEDDLVDLGYDVRRLAGVDRYQTAALVARETISVLGPWARESAAFVARGDLYPDALAASPWAYAARMPVLLTPTTTLAPRTRAVIEDLGLSYFVVCGSGNAVSDAVYEELDGLDGGEVPLRLGGADRYETARLIAEKALAWGELRSQRVGVATGERFPDGLAGGAACGARGQALLLTRSTMLPTASAGFVDDHWLRIQRPVVLGGTVAVGGSVADAIHSRLILP